MSETAPAACILFKNVFHNQTALKNGTFQKFRPLWMQFYKRSYRLYKLGKHIFLFYSQNPITNTDAFENNVQCGFRNLSLLSPAQINDCEVKYALKERDSPDASIGKMEIILKFDLPALAIAFDTEVNSLRQMESVSQLSDASDADDRTRPQTQPAAAADAETNTPKGPLTFRNLSLLATPKWFNDDATVKFGCREQSSLLSDRSTGEIETTITFANKGAVQKFLNQMNKNQMNNNSRVVEHLHPFPTNFADNAIRRKYKKVSEGAGGTFLGAGQCTISGKPTVYQLFECRTAASKPKIYLFYCEL